MGGAGTLTYNTNIDTRGFQKGINDITSQTKSGGTKMRTILGSLGIAKLVGTAFNMIRNSMDDAISRLDTMNNFPKVMSNLGISARDSQKAIDRLTEGLRGLPTTLDAGALAVQRFTSKNGDVNKSTEMFLALNNAILAGGASTEIQSSALEQLSQAYSKGRMDMMEWRTIQMAMPAQLKQIADALGITTEQLGINMREGKNTSKAMDEFMGTIQKLNTKGVKGLANFAEQAKNATGGVRTNITNMKTAIARGVANIINSLDKALKKANMKGVGDSIKALGETFEKVLKNIANAISKIDFKKMLDVMKALVPVIGALVAGFVAYNLELKVMSGINLAKNIISATSALLGLTSATELSAGAMKIFNAVMSANPIGIVLAGITGLVAGIVLLNKHLNDQNDQVNKNNKALNEYKKEMKETKEEAQEYIQTNGSELMHYQSLKNELDGLIDKNGKVKKGYEERTKFIVTTLNEALGTEIKITDGVIKNYDDLSNSIQDVINKKKAQIFIDAHEKEYQKAVQKSSSLLDTYTKALNESNKQHNEYNKWLQETADKYGVSVERLDGLLNKKIQYNEATHQEQLAIDNTHTAYLQHSVDIEEADKSLKNISKTYRSNQKVIADYELATQHMSEKNYDAVYKIYRDTINYQGKTDKETYNNYQKSINTLVKYLEDVKNNRKKYSDEEYNALITAGETKIKELQAEQERYKQITIDGQNGQLNAVVDGQKRIGDEITKGLQAQLNTLNGKKSEFSKSGSSNMSSYGSGVSSQKGSVGNKAKEVANNVISQLEKKDQAYTKGQNVSKGFSSGISSLANAVSRSASAIAQTALNAMQKTLDEHSPSKKTKEMGINFDKGFVGGLEAEEKNVYKSVDSFGDEILDRFSNAVNMETGKMSFNGTTGSVNQMLSANATFEGTNENNVYLDGEKIYENQQKITARKNLQYGGVR